MKTWQESPELMYSHLTRLSTAGTLDPDFETRNSPKLLCQAVRQGLKPPDLIDGFVRVYVIDGDDLI